MKNKSYMVTSSNPSEGKTTFAFNLALSLEKANKVLFIEADIRRPSVLNGFYQFDREILGLGEIITGTAQLNKLFSKFQEQIWILLHPVKKDLICQI